MPKKKKDKNNKNDQIIKKDLSEERPEEDYYSLPYHDDADSAEEEIGRMKNRIRTRHRD